MTETNDPQFNQMTPKRLNAVVGLITSVLVSCGLLMWSVFNLWLNILAFQANEKADQAWSTTVGMVLITCVVPFLIGLWMLFRTLGKNQNVRNR